jgi:hypothetical protein
MIPNHQTSSNLIFHCRRVSYSRLSPPVSFEPEDFSSFMVKSCSFKSGKSEPLGNYLINKGDSFRLGNPNKLLMTFEQIHQITYRHQPDFFFPAIQLHRPKVNDPGKECLLTYPATSFFDSSLSTFLLVPFSILAIIAFLYWARSNGEVKSSISSSVKSSCLLSLFLRLWIRID